MNTIRNLISLAAILATAQPAPAAVPSAINYQGCLNNASGASQEGNRAMSVKLYDAGSGGTLLYSESLGNVAVDANGVYGFQFGASGTSDTLVTETLATTAGTAVSYEKALSHTPVLPGTLSVTDGTFSWNETTGTTITLAPPPAPFVVNYAGGTVTATYDPAPPAGRAITATYRYSTSGISGALAAGAEQWLELTVDGVAQSPRQRILAVPFAMNALTANSANIATSMAPVTGITKNLIPFRSYPIKKIIAWRASRSGVSYGSNVADFNAIVPLDIPRISRVQNISAVTKNNSYTYPATSYNIYLTSSGTVTVSLVAYSNLGVRTILATQSTWGEDGTLSLQGPFDLDIANFEYQIDIKVGVYSSSTYDAIPNVYSELTSATMTYDTN